MKKFVYHQIENTSTFEFCTDVVHGTHMREESEQNNTRTPHFHKNFEILTVISGKCRCEIGNQQYEMSVGDVAFIVPFQIHAFCALENATVRRITFHDHLIWSMSSALDEKKPQNAVFRPTEIVWRFLLEQLQALFGETPCDVRRIPERQRMMVKGCLYIVGSEFLNQATLVPLRSADALITDVVRYIAEHFRSNITLQDIATEKGYSYHYLSRTFNNIFNISFKAMLNQYRMEYAYALLQDTRMPIGQIAFESGFQSIRSLDYVCRLHYGKTPRELRKQHYV